MGRDLDALLAAVDLERLADQLVGERRGQGAGARWPSPVPGHEQTGRTPPMSIFTDRSGRQRWTCWSTGASGTAIDLVTTVQGVHVAAAITWLADRYDPAQPVTTHHRVATPAPSPSLVLSAHVAACERLLWNDPQGARARRWLLEERALTERVLRANRVGYDPGSQVLLRRRGIPGRGPGVLLPVFDAAGEIVYCQARYFDPARHGRKYDGVVSSLAARPALSWPQPAGPASGPLVVCEGTIDALTVAAAGFESVAVLAAVDAKRGGQELAALGRPLVVALDNDPAGHGATTTLVDELTAWDVEVRQLRVPGDVNDLARTSGDRFRSVFAAAVRGARRRPGVAAGRSGP